MLAGAFSKPDIFKVYVPTSENDKAADRKILTALMNQEGQIALNNSVVSIKELKSIVKNEVDDNLLVQLQLKADANAQATRLIEIMDTLSETGLTSLHLLTVSPDTKQ